MFRHAQVQRASAKNQEAPFCNYHPHLLWPLHRKTWKRPLFCQKIVSDNRVPSFPIKLALDQDLSSKKFIKKSKN